MNLTLEEKDIITRLLEEGVSHAAERLGKMSRTEWGIMTSSIKEIPPVRLLSWFDRNKEEHVGVRFRSGSDVPLELVVLFPKPSADAVTSAVVRPFSDRLKKLPNAMKLTIGEVSNILAQSLIGVMADEYDATIILSIPEVEQNAKVRLLESVLEDYDGRKDVLLMSHCELFSEKLSAECSMVVMVNIAVIRRLFASN